ncbi:DEAD/DEAH box helicase family protein [Aminobacter sp. P9b]|uniref:Superfamily II DNA or RNA helicase n=1 Tax=Aminobacter ciceronei TaxID=150723 RepID=A0ABR6CAY8_9HYPH|nr:MULTISPECIES: DEAD/DEAH box helicase family protein [Aminobacter]MBA8908274.1 superfamily II DNA or RNA helicase [Aminobacter ciceronei]MBA9022046.1 superfamily II DNA or RNA helicase [Aminobacter ciceronei]MRX34590.1 DEAD/DEAH box helicase [Aminobacter sp. MDW-2]QNH34811.1 DEAD/DEAH box helicase family protein [Aminobacter sp. MDW-2]
MIDIFAEQQTIKFPERVSCITRIGGNVVYRLAHGEREISCSMLSSAGARGQRFWKVDAPGLGVIAVVDTPTTSLLGCDAVLRVPNINSSANVALGAAGEEARWILPNPRKAPPGPAVSVVVDSWSRKLALKEEVVHTGQRLQPGFRPPQLGAIFAVKAHWSVSKQAATLVLPTGTGKTDTMAALLVSEKIERLLVIVPSDALRRQIALKFARLDVLKAAGIVPADLMHPTVAVLSKALKSAKDVDDLTDQAQVIIATMSVLTAMSADLRGQLAGRVTHLFVDEAHHIGASTWRDFKALFTGKIVLQFTATPFRNDGRRVDGKFIYVYPLRRAQADGLFTSINFVPVHASGKEQADGLIARKVGEQLKADAAAGFAHLAMARTSNVERAEALHGLYARLLPEYNPVLIHSHMSAPLRAKALSELRSGASRIIVCVDMLGEGFDLPDLKIAGLHDRHRSEAVTLQFVGRFTRIRSDLGSATVIANIEAGDATSSLNALFAEDSDWNRILSVIGHNRTKREQSREDLFAGFPDADVAAETFPLESIEPRFSTVVYQTDCIEWTPESAETVASQWSTIVETPALNAEHRLLLYVRRDEERLRWTTVKSVRNVYYNLVMAHWDPELKLLFIHGSDLADLHADLAKALAGPGVMRITGEDVFRVLHGFRRLMLTNLGLSETQRKPVRYSQFMGSDIADQLDTLPGNRSRSKTNLFGLGYIDLETIDDDGQVIGRHASKETIGCSRKGKFWSYRTSNSFSEWIDWCHDLGRKLLNTSITPETILRNVVRPQRLTSLPAKKVPIGIAWPEEFLDTSEENLQLVLEDSEHPFFNCEIELAGHDIGDAIRFNVLGGARSASYELKIGSGGAVFTQTEGRTVIVRRGRTRKERPLVDVFHEDPPHIYFADGDVLIAPDILVLPRESRPAFDTGKIESIDWSGVNIKAESQGSAKKAGTVQRHVIERLLASATPYDIIFDDDGTGEVADVVAIRRSGRTLLIDLFHCKYSAGTAPGARVEDLYEVCGQAQKSVRWAERFRDMLNHLRQRELERVSSGQPSRFERGTMAVLLGMIGQSHDMHAEFAVTLVQPGYSRRKVAAEHLELLSATEAYLMETWRMPLRVWASA